MFCKKILSAAQVLLAECSWTAVQHEHSCSVGVGDLTGLVFNLGVWKGEIVLYNPHKSPAIAF